MANPTLEFFNYIDGAARATGLVVVIDVFRAFTTACYLAANGAREIIAVASLAKARKLRESTAASILVGERDGRKLPGFDYGNSPAEIEKISFAGKTVIQTTSAGTQGLLAARRAAEVITASFVNARAVAAFAAAAGAEQISLVAMGVSGKYPAEEDVLCQEYLAAMLKGAVPDVAQYREKLRQAESAAQFFDKRCDWAPKEDFDLCCAINRFDFVLRVKERFADYVRLERVAVKLLSD